MSKLISSKIMALLLLMVLIMSIGSLTNAQLSTSTSSSCVTRLNQGVCGTVSPGDKCCTIITQETHNDQECMCKAINYDGIFLSSLMSFCFSTYSDLVTFCQATLTTPSPPSDTFSPSATLVTPTSPFGTLSPSAISTPTRPSASDLTSGTKSKTNVIAVAVAVVIIVVLIIIVISVICICRRKNISNYPPNASAEVIKDNVLPSRSVSVDVHPIPSSKMSRVPPSSPATHKSSFVTVNSLQFELATLKAATDTFSDDNILGKGGFGAVYKGTLPDGREIAVKRLSLESKQGDQEFKAEIELLAKLQHRNLVRLLGFCSENDERSLVYEFMTNKSLDHFLLDSKKREELKWSVRYNIIVGIARGLVYLHDDAPEKTIHRDLKPGNVLLDMKMNPKIADFGLARICALEQTHARTEKPIGTKGYMSPEFLNGEFSTKSDVYAFGVIVLEVISGRMVGTHHEDHLGERSESLLSTAWRCWGDGKPLELIDPLLKDTNFSSEEVIKCVGIGLQCVEHDVNRRLHMSTVVQMLNPKPAEISVPLGSRYNSSSSFNNSTASTSTTPPQSATVNTNKAADRDVSSSAWSDFKNGR